MPAATDVPTPVSVSTSANVHVVNDPLITVKDGVSIPMELFVRLFPELQRDAPSVSRLHYVLMKFIGVPDFFPRFNLYKVTQIDDAPTFPNTVTITNHSNLLRFLAELTFRGCIIQSIETPAIPRLEQVFIEVPPVIYDILDATPESAVRDKVVCEYLATSEGVVSQDSIVRSINGHVRLCEPFYQGRVTTDTNLVFVKGTGMETKDDSLNDPQIDETPTLESTGKDVEIDLAGYLSQSMVFDSGETENPKSKDFELNVRPLLHRISVPQNTFTIDDPELYAFMSTRGLSKLGFPVFNGDLVELRYASGSGSGSGPGTVLVKIFTFLEPNSSFEEYTVYLSPLLLLNLGLPEHAKVVLQSAKAPAQSLTEVIPTAKSATISRVVSPITMDKTYQRNFFAELKTLFHTQNKCFRVGDKFPVCIDAMLSRALFDFMSLQEGADDEGGKEEQIIPTGTPDTVAWFRVVEISGDSAEEHLSTGQFRIDPQNTSLTSSGVEFVGIPPNSANHWNEFLEMPPFFNYSKAFASHPASFKYAKEFYTVLKTGLKASGRTNLRPAVLLHSMSRALGKTTLVRSASLDLGLNLIELDAIDFLKPGAELKSVGLLSGRIEKQVSGQLDASHCDTHHLLYIKHIEILCTQVDPNEQAAATAQSLSLKIVNVIQEFLKKYTNVLLVASSNDLDKVSDSFRQMLTFEIDVTVPTEPERLEILKFLVEDESRATKAEEIPDFFEDKVQFTQRPDFDDFQVAKRIDVRIPTLALQSAGLTPADLRSIVRKTKQTAVMRHVEDAEARGISVEKLIKVGNGGSLFLIPKDFEKAINDARNDFSDSIGAPRIPNVKWEDIGGLDLVKDEILDTIDLPLKHPELFSNGLKKRSGILFYGPPGTGKTLLAKAIATNFSLNFFSVKGPELLNMYIGESEANVRRVFQKARDAKPCVIFFDELDSVAPKRGNQGDSGGVMDRIVSQLLAELDGMSGGESSGDGVFVVGATNRPDLLDEALLRPGRFDKMLYLGISDTDEKQTKILEALTRKFKLSDEVDLTEVAKDCSFTFTGADFYALCSDSMLNAMSRTAANVDEKLLKLNQERVKEGKEEVSSRWWFDNAATPEDVDVHVTMADFRKAQSELAPSVSAEELEHYLRVKENFEGAEKKAKERLSGARREENGEIVNSNVEEMSNGTGGDSGAMPEMMNGSILISEE